jgi:hypothetical protein
MRKKPTTKMGKRAKFGKVMGEMKAGKLRSGSKSGPKVKSAKQAKAIAMSESGMGRSGKRKRNPAASMSVDAFEKKHGNDEL